jgi:DNA helicase II / ATP-dependent DNA helicase PcrA
VNKLTLAVARGRKTQSIVDRCVAAPRGRRMLVLTYTQTNQRELTSRLAQHQPIEAEVEVQGWFSFLLGHWVRPYLPLKHPGQRLQGFIFDDDKPDRYAKGRARFLDSEGRAYKRHLAQLAMEVNTVSTEAVIDRLGRIYHEIYVDEVQDLNGYDLQVLLTLMRSPIDLYLVGDVRQALIQTNVHEPMNQNYKGADIKKWFDAQEKAGRLKIEHQAYTWRSNQVIADFADSIFDSSWGFAKTVSKNTNTTGHDGVFAVASGDVEAYIARYAPMCLRHNVRSAQNLQQLEFTNIPMAKGLGVGRVLIGPTKGMIDFLRKGSVLEQKAACTLYVAVTRVRASVAFVSDDPHRLKSGYGYSTTRVYSLRLAAWMASQTLAGVSGMSACVTPKGASASMTELTTAGGEPTVADSPMPLAPTGWCGDGA